MKHGLRKYSHLDVNECLKKHPNKDGHGYIYTISCDETYYVGSSTQLNGRWNLHLRRLNLGIHFNKHLQSAFNKYGSDAFSFKVVAQSPVAVLHHLEQAFHDLYKKRFKMFNQGEIVASPALGNRFSLTEEAKAKIRKPFSLRNPDGEIINFDSLAHAAKAIGCSPGSVHCIKHPKGNRTLMGWTNPEKPQFHRQFQLRKDGVIKTFNSNREAAEALGTTQSSISGLLLRPLTPTGLTKKVKGWEVA